VELQGLLFLFPFFTKFVPYKPDFRIAKAEMFLMYGYWFAVSG
jgi:hypothetical protein